MARGSHAPEAHARLIPERRRGHRTNRPPDGVQRGVIGRRRRQRCRRPRPTPAEHQLADPIDVGGLWISSSRPRRRPAPRGAPSRASRGCEGMLDRHERSGPSGCSGMCSPRIVFQTGWMTEVQPSVLDRTVGRSFSLTASPTGSVPGSRELLRDPAALVDSTPCQARSVLR